MSEVSTLYGQVADGFSARVESISADQWSEPTSHADWTVRDMVAHVISTQQRVLGTLGEGDVAQVDEDGDLKEQWRGASGAMNEALNDPARGTKVIRGLLGRQPFELLVGQLICPDTLVHTWELSQAIGLDATLDPAAMAASTAILTPIDDAVRRPGGFADKIPTPADADQQTTFLHFVGQSTSLQAG
jgi:uncharacterized protein (TIGR03086 family)